MDTSTAFEVALDRVHARALQLRWLPAFTAFCRLSLAVGFVAPGLTKVLGHRFANPRIITLDTPIGAFFDAFFHAGAFYAFVGATQILAATLLLFPRTSALGAVIYFPIILNIFVITAALDFGGTAVVAGLMVLACLFLLCWYYPCWKGLLFPGAAVPRIPVTASAGGPTRAAWWLAALGGMGLTSVGRGVLPHGSVAWAALGLLCASGGLMLWVSVQKARALYSGWRPNDRMKTTEGRA